MLPKQHIIYGAIFSLALFILVPQVTLTKAIIVFLAAVLIDIDHYLFYVIDKKDFSLKNSFKWYKKHAKNWLKMSPTTREKYKRPVILCHGIEFLLIILILSLFSQTFLFISVGVLFHFTLDFHQAKIDKEPFYVKFSQLYTYFKTKTKPRLSSDLK